jgi:hypothetical protein
MAARYIEHRKLRPGHTIYDATVVTKTNDGWRRVSTDPDTHGDNGELIVWFVDGGASVKKPGHLWMVQ